MADRLLRANETVLAIPAYVDPNGKAYGLFPTGMVSLDSFTTAILNYWIPVNRFMHPSANGGGNISCAIKDDMTLGQTGSETDTDRTICDAGQVSIPTNKQYEGSLTGYRDKDLAGDGAYNLFNKLTFAPDVPYIIAHRIGRKQGNLSLVGDDWDLYLFETDVQITNRANNANVTATSALIPKSEVRFAYTLTA